MIRRAKIAALAVFVIVSGPSLAGIWCKLYASWPASNTARATLTPNNGWAICKQRYGYLGRIHVVYSDFVSDVYCNKSNNSGRNWGTPLKLGPTNVGDCAYDAAVGCRGDTIAVAFFDEYATGGTPWNGLMAKHSLDGGNSWQPEVQVASPSRDHTWCGHPSVCVTVTDGFSDTTFTHVGWMDYYDYPGTGDHLGEWAMHNVVRVRQNLRGNAESRVSDDSLCDYPSVCWNGVIDHNNESYYVFQQVRPDSGWEIWAQRSEYDSPDNLVRVTDNDGIADIRPCIQSVGHFDLYPDSTGDTVLIVFQRRDGNLWRLYQARTRHFFGDRDPKWDPWDIEEMYPSYATDLHQRHPNIWCNGEDIYMVFTQDRSSSDTTDRHIMFAHSTDNGDNWTTPIVVSPPWSDSASITGHGDSAFVVYKAVSGHGDFAVMQALWENPYGAEIPVYPIEAPHAEASGCSRLLQQMGDNADYMYRAFDRYTDLPTVQHSTDYGESWVDIAPPYWGEKVAIAADGDSVLCAVYVRDDTVYCSWLEHARSWHAPVEVFAGSATLKPGRPSVVLYPDRTNGVKHAAMAFPVYNTSTSGTQMLFAKADTASVVIDTIETLASLADSFVSVNIYQNDSLYVVWERSGAVVSSELEFGAGTWTQPASAWSIPTTVASAGKHPMANVEENYLHAVWRYLNTGTGDVAIRTASFELGDNPTVGGWQNGSDPSEEDSRDKTNPCRTQAGVTVWQEEGASGIWRIMAEIRGDTVTIAAPDSNCLSPQALADSSVPSPSINQVRLRTMWFEEYKTDTCSLAFQVDTFNVSDAGSDATEGNNGSKLIRKSSDDSLFAVYQDADGATMYAWSEDGSEWQRQQCASDGVYPAITSDGTGRRWIVYYDDAGSQVCAKFDSAGTFSAARTLCNLVGDGCGPISVAGSHDPSNSCAYAVFRRIRAAENDKLILVKFDASNQASTELYEGDEYVHPCVGTEWDSGESKDDIHVCWENTLENEIYYKMTSSPVDPTEAAPSYSWEADYNLSSSDDDSKDPSMHVGSDRVVIAWSEHDPYDVVVVRRDLGDTYNDFEDTVNLSESAVNSLYPVVCDGDSAIVVWEEHSGEGDVDVYASVEFEGGFCMFDNANETRYPHCLFQNQASGDSAIPIVHLVYCQEPEENYYEVGYTSWNLKEQGTGGGGGQSGPGGPSIVPMLYACRPNPFNNRTLISYQFPKAGNVSLKVFDISGRTVRTLQNGHQNAGVYNVSWDGRDDHGRSVAHGVYYYQLVAPGFRDVKKAVLAR